MLTGGKRKHKKLGGFFVCILVFLILYTVLMFAIFLLGLNTSFKQHSDVDVGRNIFGLPDMSWWEFDDYYPNNIFGNYLFAFNNLEIDQPNSYIVGLFNKVRVDAPIRANVYTATLYTFLYAGVGAFVAAFVPMWMGYLCARYRNKISSVICTVVVFVMATPIVGNAPAIIEMMRSLRLYDTFIGDWLRKASFTNMYFLIFYGFFRSLSKSYSEAAEIDGASQFGVMTKICFPLAMGLFWTVYLILFVNYWNDFTTPMLYLPSKPTLSYAIYYTTTLDSGSDFNYATRRMAALMIFAVPIVVLFAVFNKRLMTNLTMGGVKE